jgi:thioredoxin 1
MAENYPNLFHVNDEDFEQFITNSPLPVLVEFTADWCPPCRVLAPLFARISTSYQDRLRFAKIDTEANVHMPARFGIQGIPTLVLFAGGQPIGRVVGPHPGRLQQSIDQLLAEASVKNS